MQDLQSAALALYQAAKLKQTIAPLRETLKDLDIRQAYGISMALLDMKIADGERVIGKKIGLTNVKVQQMLGVDQPDFGFITDAMLVASGSTVKIADNLIQPKIEGELVFVLKEDLSGPGLSNADIIRATDYVVPALEIVDSRIENWDIKIEDTIADNASSGMLVLDTNKIKLTEIDIVRCGVNMSINGEVVDMGVGAAAFGSPINAVTWLANALGELGMPLKAGEFILSGALVKMFDVKAGDKVCVDIGGAGSCAVSFS